MSEGASVNVKLETGPDGRHCLSGHLGFDTAEDAMRQLDVLPLASGAAYRLDLSALKSIDSAGLAVILEYWRRCRQAGASLVLEESPEQLTRLIRISGLETVLETA